MTADELLHQFADALIAVTPGGIIMFWSRGAEELFGHPRAEAVGCPMIELLVPPERRAEEELYFQQALEGRRVVYEAVRRRSDGTSLSVDVSMQAVPGPAGAARHVAISTKDVSQIKYRREAAVVESRFRGLLDAVPDAMVLVNVDGRVVLVNREAERLFGYHRDELVGQSIDTLVPKRFRATHPGHRAAYAADPKTRPMAAGLDLSALRKDGTEFPAEISLSQVTVPEGTFTSAAIRDVTRRRRVEEKFRGLLEAAPDAIVIVDRTGRIVLANAQAERLFGYSRAELIGQPVELLVPDSYRGGHVAHRESYFAAPRPRAMGTGLELEAVRKDGSRFPVEISLSPLETEEGTLVSSAIRDVTRRREIERALKVAYKELESFSYSIAHDLRAPLRGMSGFAQVLYEDYASKLDADGLDALTEIRTNAARMGEQIDALLSLSKVARSELRREEIDVSAMARAIASRCAAAEPERGVEIVVHEGMSASADPALLRALLENLISNAWKFTRRQPAARVEIGAEPRDGGVTFFVKDNGAGFDESRAARLFTPFQRMHSAHEFPGTGIGLATAQRIAHRHGGRIWAKGDPGVGATFYFTLPKEAG